MVVFRGLVILSVVVLAACAPTTKFLWKEKQYTELISHFLVTEDGEKIVFVGSDYHYIFSADESLKNILQWNERRLLRAGFDEDFHVDGKGVVSGAYKVVCYCASVPDEQKSELQSFGFEEIGSGNLQFKGALEGNRYGSGGLSFDDYAELNQKYVIEVQEDFTFFGRIGRIAATPIAIAADGVATLGVVVLGAVAVAGGAGIPLN